MPSPWLFALTVGPLGFYFWLLGLLQSQRHPTVVSGLVDHALLWLGLGGLVVFGPVGQLVVRMRSATPGLGDWVLVASAFGLVASLLAHRSLRRVVVYRVEKGTLWHALEQVLAETGEEFQRTLHGFEQPSTGRGLIIETTNWQHAAIVEAHGPGAEELIQGVRPRLRFALWRIPSQSSPIALVYYSLSIAVVMAPLLTLIVTQPRAREALRVLLERLTGG